jgi:hypothetical protein
MGSGQNTHVNNTGKQNNVAILTSDKENSREKLIGENACSTHEKLFERKHSFVADAKMGKCCVTLSLPIVLK